MSKPKNNPHQRDLPFYTDEYPNIDFPNFEELNRVKNKKDDKDFFLYWEEILLNYVKKNKRFTKKEVRLYLYEKFIFNAEKYIDILFDDLIKRKHIKKVSRKGYMWYKKS